MAWSLLSSGATGFLSAASPGFSYSLPGGAPSAGVLEVLFLCASVDLTSVSAGGGASWTLQETFSNFASNNTLWRVTNGSEGASVNILQSVAGNPSSVRFMRWSGQASSPFDTGAVNSANTSGFSSPSTSSGTLAGTGELVLAFAGMWDGANLTPSGVSWTAGLSDDGNGAAQWFDATAGQSVASWGASNASAGTAAQTASAAWTSGDFTQTYTQLVAFKPSTSTNATVTMGSALAVATAAPAPQPGSLSGPAYASTAADLGGGTGSWSNTGNADGAPDGSYATWSVV
jgi:hypothetical protein